MLETGGPSPVLLLGALIFLIALAVAIFIATLVYLRRAQSEKQSGQGLSEPLSSPQPERQSVSPAREAEKGPPASLLETPARPGEVMRVIRDERTGRVLIEVEGQRYAHIREIQDASVGRRVLWAIADLIRFTGGMAANPQAVRSVSQQVTQDTSAAQETAAPEGERAGVEGERVSPLPAGGTGSPGWSAGAGAALGGAGETGQPAGERYSLIGFFRRGFEASPPAATPGPSSFIDQIEAILQDHIRRLATPLPYEVHVTTGPDNALQIEVGGNAYGSPDEVPDVEVRQLIRAAVAEWERR